MPYNVRSHVSRATREVYNLRIDEVPVHKESTKQNKELATQQIEMIYCTLKKKDKTNLTHFLKIGFCHLRNEMSNFVTPLFKNKTLTFSTLSDIVTKCQISGKQKILRAG